MLQIRTLGPLSLRIDGQAVAKLSSRKAQALLIYLVSHAGHFFTREHLQALFWSNASESKARANLRQTLRKLLAALPDGVIVQRGLDIGFDPSCDYWLDSDYAAEDETLYGGELLTGFVIPGASLWDEWLRVQREAVATRLIAAWESAAERAVAANELLTAIRYLRRIVEINPWMETTHRRLMQLYLRTDDKAAALRQYETVVTLLADELGVAPSAETEALYERAKSADATPSNLPHPHAMTPFVGRDDELAILTATLRQPETRLLTLLGLGGTGKTRLAIASARAVQDSYFDGTFLIDLTNSARLDDALAATLAVSPHDQQSLEKSLIEWLHRRRMLLLLDNFETVINSAEAIHLVRSILQHAPHVTLLVTSRERLRLRQEQVLPLEGLEMASAAPRLFELAARRASLRFVPQSAAIRQICTLVQGLPLAIEMAAAWTPELSCEAIAAAISQDLSLLQASNRDMPARQASIEAVFNASWQRLPLAQRRVLAGLSIFKGSFTLEAAQAIVQTDLAALVSLANRSLIQRIEAQRFDLHLLLRQFAAARLSDESPVRKRHADWYLNHFLNQPNHRCANQFLLAEEANVLAAWRWLAQQRAANRLAAALGRLHHTLMQLNRYTIACELYQEHIHWLEQIALPTEAETRLLADLYSRLCTTLVRLGKPEAAIAAAHRAIGLASRSEDDARVALALSTLGALQRRMGQFEDAQRHGQMALTLYQALGEWRQCARVLNDLGLVAYDCGDWAAAEQAFAGSLHHSRQEGDRNGEAYGLHNRGLVALREGRFVAAEAALRASLALFEHLHNVQLQASCRLNLARVRLAVDDLAQAQSLLQSAETLLTNRSDERIDHQVLLQRVRARLALAHGDVPTALAALRQARRLLDGRGYPSLLFEVLHDWCEAAIAAGDQQRARALLGQLDELAGQLEAPFFARRVALLAEA